MTEVQCISFVINDVLLFFVHNYREMFIILIVFQLLSRQVGILRNVNESRMKIYEEVDKNLQDLEKSHEKLKTESRADKDKCRRLVPFHHFKF